ncbi:uncharacterized protein LOC112592241, partial [Melanaphis sacchari]|uniref:uncharacterized protein LOC112592241 n=1 Tax=Melanaphis sacchari TaxID=742174 RepID=UPI000DC13CA2
MFCARALLDSGSQSNFITNELANKLQLSRKKVNYAITGIDGSTNSANFAVKTTVQSRTTSYKENLEFLILPKITPNLPTNKIKLENSQIPDTVQRGSDNKFVIQLPLTKNIDKLGDSRSIAKKRFLALENRLRKDNKLYEGYKEFMMEYLQLGHMETTPDTTGTQSYFMPHHAVYKDNSLTTKIRVVFDASCETDT